MAKAASLRLRLATPVPGAGRKARTVKPKAAKTKAVKPKAPKTKVAGTGMEVKSSKTGKSSKSSTAAKSSSGTTTPRAKSTASAADFEPVASRRRNIKSGTVSKPRRVKSARGALAAKPAAAGNNSSATRAANGRFESAGRAEPKKAKAVKFTRLSLVHKVYSTIDGELSKLEKHKGATSQDRERASRALSQITSSLGKASDMQFEIEKASKKGAKKADTEALAHAETLRQKIADRVERVSRDLATRKRAG